MASRPPADFEAVLAAIACALDVRAIGYMVIGGQAVLVHGRPRLTDDIDVTLALGPESLDIVRAVCDALHATPLPANVDAFVRETFVLPVRLDDSHARIDFIFSTTDYERQAIVRADRITLAGAPVAIATAEDLIIHKLFAARPRDLEDAESVVRRRRQTLDWTYLEKWARAFAEVPGSEGMPAAVGKLRRGPEP